MPEVLEAVKRAEGDAADNTQEVPDVIKQVYKMSRLLCTGNSFVHCSDLACTASKGGQCNGQLQSRTRLVKSVQLPNGNESCACTGMLARQSQFWQLVPITAERHVTKHR